MKYSVFSLVTLVAALSGVPPAAAASVSCVPGASHPVCVANYAAYPRGALALGQSSSGTAVVNGRQVNWTCLGGMADPDPKKNIPRKCTY